jgi:hypothetical protein
MTGAARSTPEMDRKDQSGHVVAKISTISRSGVRVDGSLTKSTRGGQCAPRSYAWRRRHQERSLTSESASAGRSIPFAFAREFGLVLLNLLTPSAR